MQVRAFQELRARDHRAWVSAALLSAILVVTVCRADDGSWSATLYAGAATNKFATHIFSAGGFEPDGAMMGVAPDVKLATPGWGFTLEAEGQLTQYVLGHDYQTVALGIGLRFHNFPWSDRLATSLAIYTGPSYATNPPAEGIGFENTPVGFERKHLLNYVSIEYAMAVSRASPWDICFRAYHRSGAFGVYSHGADEGTTLGLGVRRRF